MFLSPLGEPFIRLHLQQNSSTLVYTYPILVASDKNQGLIHI